MKNKIVSFLVLMCFLATPLTTNAQFFKKLKDKIEEKTDKVLGTVDNDSLNDTSSKPIDNAYSTNNTDTKIYEPFKRGEIVIFEDVPSADEIVNELPSKWRENKLNKNSNSEIVIFEGEKVIRIGERNGISPIILENQTDYLPENFTLEFDASFSANTGEQRYWLNFYDQKTQIDAVEYETRSLELMFTTFAVMDGYKEGTLNDKDIYDASPNLVWRHISISYNNNNLDVYYNGKHLLRQQNIEGNLIGVTISRSDFSDENRYIKNMYLATTIE